MFNVKSVALAALMGAAFLPGAAFAGGNGSGPTGFDAPVNSLAANEGHILCTAAINSDGTVATAGGPGTSHVDVAHTLTLGAGEYQVAFLNPCSNVTIKNGFFRIVQADVLTASSLPTGTSCSVADRSGVVNAVFVQCDVLGTLTNTPFTISVSR